jgi:uncharacterized protein with NRDE domain
MCTLVILRRPGHSWPLIVAANRDELLTRPWSPPARHWPDRDNVIAGRDDLADGTWLALNDDGVIAAILNRRHSLGPVDDKRSRGELPLEAVDHAEAREAASALKMIDPASYRSFNMVIADSTGAFWLRSTGETGSRVSCTEIQDGLSMITAYDLNDMSSPRIQRQLPRFQSAPVPDPDSDDWFAWQGLMAGRDHDDDNPGSAMTVSENNGFGTGSSSLIALPGPMRVGIKPVWLFAAGAPDEAPYEPIFQ